jgi:hexosaminidase
MNLDWNIKTTPVELHAALRTLAEEYPIREVTGDANMSFRAGATLPSQLRAVGAALAGLPPPGVTREEARPFTTLGIMLDCSRNAVMRVDHLKQWLRRLALLGYNQVMLYTEDTYEIPGEPRFGFQRGGYTQAELRELDGTAAGLGIELVGCIQTLGHLEQILRWSEYRDIVDCGGSLLVGEPKTYQLIGKMLDAIGGALRTRRIHIGMDEAWHMGRGAYLDRHGGRRRFDVFNEHLAAVMNLCRERGLQPMIWSDMYFAMGSPKHDYYDPAGVIPPDVVAAIPKDVQLVYWDYFKTDVAFYRDWIGRHRAMGFEPIMASAIWTWGQLWYNHGETEAKAGACLEACRREGVKELFFCMWGDDGAYCDFDSALAGLAWAAERAYTEGLPDTARLAARFRAICGGDYASVHRAGALTDYGSAWLLWDDPILGIFANEGLPPATNPPWAEMRDHFARLAAELTGLGGDVAAGDLNHARLLAETLARKMTLRAQLVAAYDARDRAALAVVREAALTLAPDFDLLAASWREGWMRRNKPQGFEVIQLRLAQQAARHRELALRIEELLSGAVASIPELDDRPREVKGTGVGWRFLASGSTSL